LPERQKNHTLDGAELQYRFKRYQEISSSEIEQEQSIKGQADRQIVNGRDVQVSAVHTTTTTTFKFEKNIQDTRQSLI